MKKKRKLNLVRLIFLYLFFYNLEMLSEAVKLLKGEYCVRAINELNMDYAIIFCRTKIDCDNLESYLNSIGNFVITLLIDY